MLTVVIPSFYSSKLVEERITEIKSYIPIIIIEIERDPYCPLFKRIIQLNQFYKHGETQIAIKLNFLETEHSDGFPRCCSIEIYWEDLVDSLMSKSWCFSSSSFTSIFLNSSWDLSFIVAAISIMAKTKKICNLVLILKFYDNFRKNLWFTLINVFNISLIKQF